MTYEIYPKRTYVHEHKFANVYPKDIALYF